MTGVVTIDETPLQRLERARKILAELNWVKGTYTTKGSDGQFTGCCLLGSLFIAPDMKTQVKYDEPSIRAARRLSDLIDSMHGIDLVMFNDYRAENKEEVLALMDQVIAEMKAEVGGMTKFQQDVLDCLVAAREELVRRPWVRGSYIRLVADSQLEGCCAVGAIRLAREKQVGASPWVDDVVSAAAQALNISSDTLTGYGIISYNDAHAAGKEQILAIYDEAIRRAKAEVETRVPV